MNGSAELIEGLGITTYCLLWLTAILGIGTWKLRIHGFRPKYHYISAILALISATIHMSLVLFLP